ncbi:MAG: VOC family protein [Bacteroidetes bacterium]|nr:VOC family protein [Bacteroidota bacterium]HET6244454.1 VOC family protein [Bacteroidia bacterium]
MKINRIKETCLYVKNLESTEKFYTQIIGLVTYSKVVGKHIFFKAGDSMLLCFLKGVTKEQSNLPSHYAEGKIHYAFEVDVDEYENCRNKIKLSHIKIEHEQSWKNNLKSFYFRDPDLHLVEILQAGIW